MQISDDFDKQMVKSTMKQALEIIEKKFPVDSTEIEIKVFERHSTLLFYFLTKEKGKEPCLEITSDFEDDTTSDSEDEN